MNWICSQIGAREHYSVPRALHSVRKLTALCTDFWAGGWKPILDTRIAPGFVRSLGGRFHRDLADAKVISWNGLSIFEEVGLRYHLGRGGSKELFLGYCAIGKRFAERVRDCLDSDKVKGGSILFAYDTGGLETIQWCRNHGFKCVLGQMDPGRVETALVQEEQARWPEWIDDSLIIPESYFRRREEEWRLADRIVVNSEFCRQALIQQGVPPEKLSMVPLSYEPALRAGSPSVYKERRFSKESPLRILWLGQVILRKGIQYLVAAARKLESAYVHFDVVGPIGISPRGIKSAPSNLTFHGRVTREQTATWYARSDVFILPTLSDGFAITQLEAMAHGLPVIATPSCGSVVSNGVDGFIVPARDPDGLVEAIEGYLANPAMLLEHKTAGVKKSAQFSVKRLSDNLRVMEDDLFRKPRNTSDSPVLAQN